MKGRIIEIVELGQPQSLIQRENAPITELIETNLLIKELNEQLLQYNVSSQNEQLICPCCGSDKTYKTDAIHCNRCAVTTEI